MDWIGIGVIIIGLALLALVAFLIKPLKNLTEVFANLQKTTDELPDQIADITTETANAISEGRNAIKQVNSQMEVLKPLFRLIGNIVYAVNGLTSSIVQVNATMKEKAEKGSAIERYNLEWIYGIMTIGYCFVQRKKASK
ncbi:DUF948 domain-containing protein [Virgibacillus siamensis]|uniref:DUF948 domain-containing protein n=1 Tax=Virgibacillus siamensis TaxID=480071 RepID=UPI000985F7A2|nr:DUF948 domain-containing protein [Virgibacillus siamensis]